MVLLDLARQVGLTRVGRARGKRFIALSGEGLAEQQLFDLGNNSIRTQLATVQGAAIPFPYGGKQRQIQVDLDLAALQTKGLAPADVVNAISVQNLILPAGTSKIGNYEYAIEMNSSPASVLGLNEIPIKTVNGSTVASCTSQGRVQTSSR